MKRLNGIKLSLLEDESSLIKKVAEVAGVKRERIKYFSIVKKSLDARDKGNIFYTYNIDYSLSEEFEQKRTYPQASGKVAVIGGGPCGLFCALYLARCGVKPIVFERGKSVDERRKVIDRFVLTKQLDVNCNIQFGEGGAGTFSDGKLTTRTNNEKIAWVLDDFVEYGAPKEIKYLSKPHIGSDNLPKVVKNIRKRIIELGGEFKFDTLVCDVECKNGKISGITCIENGKEKFYEFDKVVLAVGHSARDTFEMLYKKGVAMEQKPFAMGFRIEHLQSEIGFSQYGNAYEKLPSADYNLVSHAGERDVFTFCMCPGGYVMPATSEEGQVVVNGMSEFKRDGVNANSAIVCKIETADYGYSDSLAGVRYQREIERKAYELGGGGYVAPVQLVGDFIKGKESFAFKSVKATYPLGTKFAFLQNIYKKEVTNSIISAIIDMDKRLKGFSASDAVLTGVESRTSSPLRIIRDESGQNPACKGLYPAGEGAGYAGGITSSAVDGIKTALLIVSQLQNSQ